MLRKYKTVRPLIAAALLMAMAFGTLIIGGPEGWRVSASETSFRDLQNPPKAAGPAASHGGREVYFEENKGQFNEKVRYFARGTNGYDLFLTATDAVYVVHEKAAQASRSKSEEGIAFAEKKKGPKYATAVYMSLAGANALAETSGADERPHLTNYFRGEESNWRTGIRNFGTLRTSGIYEGIDMVWQGGEGGAVRYDFVVQPDGDPNQIEWELKGANSAELTTDGALLIKTAQGEIRQNKPFTYQETGGKRQEVESRFVLEGGEGSLAAVSRVRFAVGSYDRTKPLVIDPTTNVPSLAFSTLIGGAGGDSARAIDVDHAGNTYVAGDTLSAGFPVTPGTFDTSQNGNTDVFVLKLNPSGTGLLYSTFIGGDQEEAALDLRVDASGNAYLAGYAVPHPTVNYPTTTGAFDTTHNGGDADAFVTKLNANGSALLYSTFIGGSGLEDARGLGLDGAGNAYITGRIGQSPSDFPVTQGAYDTTANGGSEAFITKLNAAGSALAYSTFIGGSGNDAGLSIAVDQAGNAVISGTGGVGATPYPTTTGAYDTTFNGVVDVAVTKLNAAGSALIYSTFIGGGGADIGNDIALDAGGNAYITGLTNQNAVVFPTTTGAWDTSPNGSDGFVSKLNSAGSALSYSTFIGGVNFDEAFGIAVDQEGNAIITGRTFFDAAAAYPTTPGAFASQHSGGDDAFLTKLNATGSALIYSTFLGGSGTDAGNDIALDAAGNAIVSGSSLHAGAIPFPATAWAFDSSQNGNGDAFISKISFRRQLANNFSDFNGDGRADFAVARNTAGQLRWHISLNGPGTYQAFDWGLSTDYFVPADYDGDGKTDIAVWRPGATGVFYMLNSSNGTFRAEILGQTDDNPGVTADYDGDGKADPAIYRRGATAGAQSHWLYRGSLNPGHVASIQWGIRSDTLAPGDYDGDGKTDFVIKRITGGQAYFWRKLSSGGNDVVQFGIQDDVAYPGDYDGDGKTDLAIVRVEGTTYQWWIRPSSTGAVSLAAEFGRSGDFIVQGDYDGDGKTDIAIWRPSDSNYYILRSSSAYRSYFGFKWGLSTDFPIGGSTE